MKVHAVCISFKSINHIFYECNLTKQVMKKGYGTLSHLLKAKDITDWRLEKKLQN